MCETSSEIEPDRIAIVRPFEHHDSRNVAIAKNAKRDVVSRDAGNSVAASSAWAKANGVAFTDIASFAREARVVAEVQRAVDNVNSKVSNVEAIKRFTVLPTEWTVDGEELTPTLKLKRRAIVEKYAGEIESLYA